MTKDRQKMKKYDLLSYLQGIWVSVNFDKNTTFFEHPVSRME